MKKISSILILFNLLHCIVSQETKKELTLEDAVMGYYKGLYPKNMYGLSWTDNNQLYIRENNNINIYINFSTKKKKTISLTKDTIKNTDQKRIRNFKYQNANSYSYSYGNRFTYKYDKKETTIILPQKAANQLASPNNEAIAYTIDNNLFIANSKDSIIEITNHKNKNIVSGQSIHRNEFGITNGIFWSNNSEKIAFYQKDETDVHNYPLLNINNTPGELNSIKYPMAGQKSEYAKVGIYNLFDKSITYLITEQEKDDYLTNLTWGPNNNFIYIAELNRDQNHLKWAQYDANSGKRIHTIFEEKNHKWVEPEYPLYFIPEKSNEFITLSERDGFMNIYHYNTDGKLLKQITRNKWVTTKIKHVSKNKIYFEGTGSDPRSLHTYTVSLDGSNQIKLTKEKGIHKTKLSPNKNYLIDQYSNITTPGITQIINLKNSKNYILNKSNNPLENYSVGKTELNEIKSNDDTKLYSRLIKPSYFDESEKYPVLVYVYGGPHAQLVTNSWLAGASLWMHWMAEQGYIIFTIDGRGSANRGFEFESSIFRNLGDVEMKDQISGLNYLKGFNYIDTNRLAVHGWSYGGFMTTSLMTRYPNLFNVGVAGGPVIDWKWYEVMYGERYMDQPQTNKEGYKNNSLLNYAKFLKGDLLLIHGTADDVVVMQHNLAFVKKCVEEEIHVDFFPYPMHKHNVRGKDRVHLMEKVLNYIISKNNN